MTNFILRTILVQTKWFPLLHDAYPAAPQGRGGGTLNCFWYIGLDPVSTVNPQINIRSIRHTQKNIWKLVTPPPPPKKKSQFYTLTLRKALKFTEMTPQNSPDLWWTKKISTILSYPIPFFWKPPKILKFQILNPQNGPSLCIYKKNIRVPPPPPPGPHSPPHPTPKNKQNIGKLYRKQDKRLIKNMPKLFSAKENGTLFKILVLMLHILSTDVRTILIIGMTQYLIVI